MLVMTLVYEPNLEQEYLKNSKVGLQAADNVFQWNMVDGICQNIGANSICICNSIPVGSFPAANKKIVFKSEIKNISGIKIHNVGFLNLPIVKPVVRFFAFVCELMRVSISDNRVLTYGLYLPQLLAMYMCKRVFRKNLDITLVIDDLPAQYGIIHGNFISKKLKQMVGKIELNVLNNKNIIDHFVLLSEHMRDAIELKERNYTVVEGIAKAKQISNVNLQIVNSNKKIVFYAGTLDPQFGIDLMLDAFSLIEGDEYEFWICGNGGARNRVERMQEVDSRIRYFGFVDKNRADDLMRQSSVLINPRPNSAAFTRYSFPSKTIEYLLSGKPVIMYKLDGIPSEYDDHLFYISESTPESIAEQIQKICGNAYSNYLKVAQEGAQWVNEKKNPKIQMGKVLSLFNKTD